MKTIAWTVAVVLGLLAGAGTEREAWLPFEVFWHSRMR